MTTVKNRKLRNSSFRVEGAEGGSEPRVASPLSFVRATSD